ncbi:hypothetical protein BATDEDRAFT_22069 [Batrachochytrium dendrobatidis JAM81]|uniref:alpha-1,2-Mannosidase n=1 Tax=Batrachochytrium dendrobatidis (strain JAM81 / FGSC 10211) TaxID=684364 RepID=F4NS55_BATDJ|nr:uncharacterized protein BATDEDRAFT_22069 [Batrachochytrium dendrobatidis JAM81]EGF83400.1 hypothetical protein BATDEDRAFT_22069 [Batrachochytrium dendrobatidis JAM81]|eukprot:XP_006675460.1 hypothetical protein BATDEDRAFT_22069 [Batrachochytrium dendrobatidis JAM81]
MRILRLAGLCGVFSILKYTLAHTLEDQQYEPTPQTTFLHPKPLDPFIASRIYEYKTKIKEIGFALNLIESLGTAVVLEDAEVFSRLVNLIKYIDVEQDIDVSVMEINTRIIGGLLSAHILIYLDESFNQEYDESLLVVAIGIAKKILAAFDTPTGLPYEQFTWLSHLTDDPIYEQTARKAIRAIWDRRSKLNLFGSHIDVVSGEWIHPDCFLGGGIEGFVEYLLKTHISFSDEKEYGIMFKEIYQAVKLYMQKSDHQYASVNLESGATISSKQMFFDTIWPSIQVLSGNILEADQVWKHTARYLALSPFLPDTTSMPRQDNAETENEYLLQSETAESLWHLYAATKDESILEMVFELIDRLNMLTRTECGFASISNIVSLEKKDKTPLAFISKTLKYLYLILDQKNEFNVGNYIFNAEGHVFPAYDTFRTLFHPKSDDTSTADRTHKKVFSTTQSSHHDDKNDAFLAGIKLNICPIGG